MKHFKLICFIIFGLLTCSCNGHYERKAVPVEIDQLILYKDLGYIKAKVYSQDLGYSFDYKFPIDMYDELLEVFESKTLSAELKTIYITQEVWVKDSKSTNDSSYNKKKKHKKSKYSY